MESDKESFWGWAYNHKDISNPKYSTKSHAGYVTATGTLFFVLGTYLASHFIFTSECGLMRPSAPFFGYFKLAYLIFMILSRYM